MKLPSFWLNKASHSKSRGWQTFLWTARQTLIFRLALAQRGTRREARGPLKQKATGYEHTRGKCVVEKELVLALDIQARPYDLISIKHRSLFSHKARLLS